MIRDLDENILIVNISAGESFLKTEGIKEFEQQAESAKKFYSERKQVIKTWVFDNLTVAVEIDYNGVLATDLPNEMTAGDTLGLKIQQCLNSTME